MTARFLLERIVVGRGFFFRFGSVQKKAGQEKKAAKKRCVVLGAIHEPCGLFMCTFETPNVTAVIGRNFSSVLSEYDFSGRFIKVRSGP